MTYYVLKNREAQAVQYKGPASVSRMMDLWGTRGFNNSPDGLCFTTYNAENEPQAFFELQKGDWLVRVAGSQAFGGFRWFTNEEFKAYFEKAKR